MRSLRDAIITALCKDTAAGGGTGSRGGEVGGEGTRE